MIVTSMLSLQVVMAAPDVSWTEQLSVTQGANAGYVEDKVCANCHLNKYLSYQSVGMAKSFAKWQEMPQMERFGEEFYHAASDRYYRIDQKGDDLIFSRYNKGPNGQPVNHFQQPIDWVMGSGNRARSYIYQTEAGEMFQLPLGWYTEDDEWGMSPGFEKGDHLGVRRPIKRQCLFCHNALPELAIGADWNWMPHTFPKKLPSGTGCQRCHGPGGEHVKKVLAGGSLEQIKQHIVNPAKLSPDKRDAVCFQCHLLPSVSVIGTRHIDRTDMSFRPGQVLSDFLVHVVPIEEDQKHEDKFEINHHGFRFSQSQCYQKSDGKLGCISCHDPHVKPAKLAFQNTVVGVCLECHTNSHENFPLPDSENASENCVSCHMPTRRTTDVVKVTMTDHKIARGPFDKAKLTQFVKREEPIIVDIALWGHEQKLSDSEQQLYQSLALLSALPSETFVNRLEAQLHSQHPTSPVPYLVLANNRLKLQQYETAIPLTEFLIKQWPTNHRSWFVHGVAQTGMDQLDIAANSLKQSLNILATPEASYNLGLVLYKQDALDDAKNMLQQSIELRPNFVQAWLYLGRIHRAQGKLTIAESAYKRTLEIEPALSSAYIELIKLYTFQEKNQQARSVQLLGLRLASDKTKIKAIVLPTGNNDS